MTSIAALQSIVNGTSSTAATTDAVAEAEDRFLKLLIAQMQNQDPLNPLDNAEITSQMAQLSTVTGINKLNTSLETLQMNLQTSQALELADMIGQGVYVAGSTVALYSATNTEGETSAQGILGVNLSGAADSVVVTIRDASGTAIYSAELGAQSEGILNFVWDGQTTEGETAASGVYAFEVAASRNGEKVDATGLSFGEVLSVTNKSTGAVLNVENIGAIGASDIVQIY